MKKYDVIISGRGIAGLAAALAIDSAEEPKKILIIDNRPNVFTRVNQIALNIRDRQILRVFRSNLGANDIDEADQQFFSSLNNTSCVAIKDIESFLYRSLLKRDKKQSIDFLFQSEIKLIDFPKGTLIVKAPNEEIKFSFDYLIGAEGASQHSYKLLQPVPDFEAEWIELNNYRETIRQNTQRFHSYNAWAIFRLSTTNNQTFQRPAHEIFALAPNDKLCLFKQLTSKTDTPNSFKLAFLGEIPEAVYKDIDANLHNYLLTILPDIAEKLHEDVSNISIEIIQHKKNFLSGQFKRNAFKSAPLELNPPLLKSMNDSGEQRYYFLTGDALLSGSDYRIGQGVSLSLNQALRVGKMITGAVDAATFIRGTNEEMRRLAQYITSIISLYSQKKVLAECYERNAAIFEDQLKNKSCSIA